MSCLRAALGAKYSECINQILDLAPESDFVTMCLHFFDAVLHGQSLQMHTVPETIAEKNAAFGPARSLSLRRGSRALLAQSVCPCTHSSMMPFRLTLWNGKRCGFVFFRGIGDRFPRSTDISDRV